jgi:hypothetical protein
MEAARRYSICIPAIHRQREGGEQFATPIQATLGRPAASTIPLNAPIFAVMNNPVSS